MRETSKPEWLERRDSWLRVFATVSAVVAMFWIVSKVQIEPLKVDMGGLLSLVLSVFAMALSVAFYFRATDTSNTFYDNTYKFTREMSEVLGRIEAGFGERLRHLDEGYS